MRLRIKDEINLEELILKYKFEETQTSYAMKDINSEEYILIDKSTRLIHHNGFSSLLEEWSKYNYFEVIRHI